jgi:hypothetical protein
VNVTSSTVEIPNATDFVDLVNLTFNATIPAVNNMIGTKGVPLPKISHMEMQDSDCLIKDKHLLASATPEFNADYLNVPTDDEEEEDYERLYLDRDNSNPVVGSHVPNKPTANQPSHP